MKRRHLAFFLLLFVPALGHAVPAAAASVYMEEMTWMEVRDRVRGGATIAIVPTGGIEQNGPQLVTGMHNVVVRFAAGEIARKLGNALVAPVIPVVPSGRIEPAEGNMRFPGTLSLSDRTFAAVLEDVARSLKQNGFRMICFIGDHGGAQKAQWSVANRLTQEWASSGVRVLQVSDYYSRNGQYEWDESMGIHVRHPDAHAGHIDTSEMMAIDAQGVRDTMIAARDEDDYRSTGAAGDSSQASANYGRRYMSLKIEAAISQIQNAISGEQ